jgi:hypothetical protein
VGQRLKVFAGSGCHRVIICCRGGKVTLARVGRAKMA